MRRLLLASALLLVGCDGGAPADGVPVSCAAYGTYEDGLLSAEVREGDFTGPFLATCTRATRTTDRVVIRAFVLNGSRVDGEIVLTALGTSDGAYAIGGGTASGRYISRGIVHEAVEGGITLGTVSASGVSGAFDFTTDSGLSVVGGEFTLPLR